jgi:hypothetical protein
MPGADDETRRGGDDPPVSSDESAALFSKKERSGPGRPHSPPSPPARRDLPAPDSAGAEACAFRFPEGIEMIEGENYRQREGHDAIYLQDEEASRYQYTIAVSADRAAAVFRALAGLLTGSVCAVLEIPGPGEGHDDVCEVWSGKPAPREALLRAFADHERLFVHDGMIGFGAVSPDARMELFLDEHKLLYFYTPEMDEVDRVLDALGIPALRAVRHFSELGHVHVSLASRDAGEPGWEAVEKLKRRLGLEWEESKEYS